MQIKLLHHFSRKFLTIQLSSDQQEAAKPEKETYEAKVKQRMMTWTAVEKVVSWEDKTI